MATATTWWVNQDLSGLNDPVRFDEFVTTKNGKLWLAGKRLLIWGANVGPWFVMSTKEAIREAIRRFARAGGNAIRVHHTDSKNFPNFFCAKDSDPDAAKRTFTTDQLDRKYMDQLSWLIACCADNGIRVWLDLWDYRQFTGADLQAKPWLRPLFDKPVNDDGRNKGLAGYYALVNADVRKELIQTFRQVLEWQNEYRSVRYCDDPAIAFIDLGNENRLCWATKGFDPINDTVINSDYERWWVEAWNNFLDRVYPVSGNLVSPADLKKPGVGKRLIAMFLADQERTAFREMRHGIADLWKSDRPIVTHCQWGDAPFHALASLSNTGNGCAGHWYSRQSPADPNRMAPELDGRLWSSVETCIAGHAMDGMWLGVSEWGPVQQSGHKRESIGACVDSIRAMANACIRQDVDAPFLFMYQQGFATDYKNEGYEFGMDDAVMNEFIRQAFNVRDLSRRPTDPKQLRTGRIGVDDLFGYRSDIAPGGFVQSSAHTSAWLRELVNMGRCVRMQMPSVPELPWLGSRMN